MSRRLEDRRALVTRGRLGIGAAIVTRLVREGAHVAVTYVGNPYRAAEGVKAAQTLGVKGLVTATAGVQSLDVRASPTGRLCRLRNFLDGVPEALPLPGDGTAQVRFGDNP